MEQRCVPALLARFKEVDHESDASSSSSITWRQGSGISSVHSSPLRQGSALGCNSSSAQQCVQACAQLCQLLDTIVVKEAVPSMPRARAGKQKAAAAAGNSAAAYQDTLQDCSTLLQDLITIQQQLQPRKRKRAGSLTDNYARARQQQLQQQQQQQRGAASKLGTMNPTPAAMGQDHADPWQPSSSAADGSAAVASATEEEELEGWVEDEVAPISSSAARGAWLKRCYKEIEESKTSALLRLKFAEAVREAHRTSGLLLTGLTLGLADPGAHAFSKRHMLTLTQQLLGDVAALRALAGMEPAE